MPTASCFCSCIHSSLCPVADRGGRLGQARRHAGLPNFGQTMIVQTWWQWERRLVWQLHSAHLWGVMDMVAGRAAAGVAASFCSPMGDEGRSRPGLTWWRWGWHLAWQLHSARMLAGNGKE
eukprot:1159035-Pelagomonas_calceolata.AAC.2